MGFFGPVLIVLAVASLVGAPLAVSDVSNRLRARRLARTPRSSVAQAAGGSAVKIAGRALPAGAGALLSPLTGRRALAMNVEVTATERRDEGGRTHHETKKVLSLELSCPFLVDDGSGPPARIEPAGARSTWRRADAPVTLALDADGAERLFTFLHAHAAGTRHLVLPARASYAERVLLQAGDPVFVAGPSRREEDGRLVLASGRGRAGELVLTDESENEVVGNLRFPVSAVWYAAALVLALLAGAFGSCSACQGPSDNFGFGENRDHGAPLSSR